MSTTGTPQDFPKGLAAAFAPLFVRAKLVQKGNMKKTKVWLRSGEISKPVFLRESFKFIGEEEDGKRPTIKLKWLTISAGTRGDITFKNLDVYCKTQVTARSTICANNCTFRKFDQTCESAIEIYSSSTGSFTKSVFYDGTKAAVAVRDRSMAKFKECKFPQCEQGERDTAVLALDSSHVEMWSCKLESSGRWTVYLYRKSTGIFVDCTFQNQLKSKALFLYMGCKAIVHTCQFLNCQNGGIMSVDNGLVWVQDSTFKNTKNSCIHAMKNSDMRVFQCEFEDCECNGVHYEFSTGFCYDSRFNSLGYPAIAVYGTSANPVIYKCEIYDAQGIAVVVRDAASPVFEEVTVQNSGLHAFSISDFARPVIHKCEISESTNCTFSIFNGATPVIVGNKILEPNASSQDAAKNVFPTIDVFTEGNPKFRGNVFMENEPTVRVTRGGILEPENFVENVYKAGENDWNHELALGEDGQPRNTEKELGQVCMELSYDEDESDVAYRRSLRENKLPSGSMEASPRPSPQEGPLSGQGPVGGANMDGDNRYQRYHQSLTRTALARMPSRSDSLTASDVVNRFPGQPMGSNAVQSNPLSAPVGPAGQDQNCDDGPPTSQLCRTVQPNRDSSRDLNAAQPGFPSRTPSQRGASERVDMLMQGVSDDRFSQTQCPQRRPGFGAGTSGESGSSASRSDSLNRVPSGLPSRTPSESGSGQLTGSERLGSLRQDLGLSDDRFSETQSPQRRPGFGAGTSGESGSSASRSDSLNRVPSGLPSRTPSESGSSRLTLTSVGMSETLGREAGRANEGLQRTTATIGRPPSSLLTRTSGQADVRVVQGPEEPSKPAAPTVQSEVAQTKPDTRNDRPPEFRPEEAQNEPVVSIRGPPEECPCKQKCIDVAQLFEDKLKKWTDPEKTVSCMYCKERPATGFLSPCGHRVICSKCAEEKKSRQRTEEPNSEEKCKLCQVPIKDVAKRYCEERCVICLEAKCDTIMLPCGHQCVCFEDATKCWLEKKQCPVCQARVVSFRHVFALNDNDGDGWPLDDEDKAEEVPEQ